jgi:hypothetical protein
MSHLPDVIRVQVATRTAPLPSLLVLTRIVMHELNDYWSVHGPTDEQGVLRITRDDLLRNAATTKSFYEDEFADVETQLAGLIEVRVLDEAGIERALEAAAALPDYPYEVGYVQKLNTARAALLVLGRVLVEVEVSAEGGDCEVKAEQPI